MPAKAERTRQQRTVTATDSEWERIRARAKGCQMTISQYVVARLAAPEPAVGAAPVDPAGVLQRIEWSTRFLFELERARVLQDGSPETLDALIRRTEESVARERKLE